MIDYRVDLTGGERKWSVQNITCSILNEIFGEIEDSPGNLAVLSE
jgi:hypothetical protein